MQYTIRELRARYHLRQRDVAKLVGVSEQTIRAWERRPWIIKVQKLQELADLFKVKIDDIFVGEDAELYEV